MVKIVATDSRLNCRLTAEGGGEDDDFFKTAIAVYDALNPSCTSGNIALDFLVAIVNYMVDDESDWIAGDIEKCEQQDRCIEGVISALECFQPNAKRDRAIEKAKAFVEENRHNS